MRKTLAAAVLMGLVSTGLMTSAPAEAAARHFPSCKALNRVYPHGVGLARARDVTSGVPVRNFTRNRALYLANNGPRPPGARPGRGEYDLDRDNDKIACEKR